MDYAGRARRFTAWVTDIVIVVLFIMVLNWLGAIDTLFLSEDDTVSLVHAGTQALAILAYFVVLTAAFGATLGKMAMGMKVVDAQGTKPGFGLIFIREFILAGLGPIPFLMFGANAAGSGASLLVTFLVVFWILIDDRQQGLHDKAASTFVVRR